MLGLFAAIFELFQSSLTILSTLIGLISGIVRIIFGMLLFIILFPFKLLRKNRERN